MSLCLFEAGAKGAFLANHFQALRHSPTVGENIITIKMRNNFCYPLKMVIFVILR